MAAGVKTVGMEGDGSQCLATRTAAACLGEVGTIATIVCGLRQQSALRCALKYLRTKPV